MLERREQVMQVARRGLLAGLFTDRQGRMLGAAGKRRAPFAVAAVEGQNLATGAEAQHMAQVMRLRFIERGLRSGAERGCDVEPGAAEIVSGQMRQSRMILTAYRARWERARGRETVTKPLCALMPPYRLNFQLDMEGCSQGSARRGR